jgi:hypothetical protein
MENRISIIIGLIVFCLLLPQPVHADPISIIVSLVAGITWAKVGALIAGAVVSSVISFGISAIAGAFTKKPQSGTGRFAEQAGQRLSFKRSTVEPHAVIYGRIRTSGPLVFVATSDRGSTVNSYLHMVIALAGHEVEEIETVYLNEDPLTLDADGWATNDAFVTSSGGKLVRVRKHLGTDDQIADPLLIEGVTGWTANHRLQGIAYIYLRLEYNQSNFPNGVPDVSAIVKGKKCYDPRTTLTAYTDNPALCIRDYLTNNRYGLGASSAEIDDDSFIAGANVCDETVNLADSTTQTRYTCNGLVDTSNKPIDVLKDVVTCCAGVIPHAQGKFRFFPGAYTAPSVYMDESWLASEIEVVAKVPRNELFNAIKGVIVNPANNWQADDVPIVTNSTYEAQDGGYQIVRDLEQPFTTDLIQAQRINKIALEKGRQGLLVTMPCNYKALQLAVYDTVYLSIDKMGWDEKIFRVIHWDINADGNFGVVLQEESSASYDWTEEETVIDPAPDTNLPLPWYVAPPGNPQIDEELYNTTDGSGVKAKAIITWAESPDAFNARYNAQFRVNGDTDWITLGDSVTNNIVAFDIPPNTYDFRIRAINYSGASSEWVSTTTEIKGLTAPPEDVTGFTLNAINNSAHLQWNPSPDLDVKVGGSFVIKHSSKTSGATWSDGIALADNIGGIATNAVLPLLNGTYMIKAKDSEGHLSVNHTAILTTVPNLLRLNAVETSTQHPTFSGTKTSMAVDGGDDTLYLDASGLFDDATGDFDDKAGLFDDGGGAGFATSGSYQFDAPIDLGDVYTSRVTMDIEAYAYDSSTTFDGTSGFFDEREGLFDGEDLAQVELIPFIRTTNDDPSGSPTWSDWRRFMVGDYTARGYDFKIDVESQIATNNMKISTLAATVDMPDRVEEHLSESIASGGSTITYDKAYFAKPDVAVTVQSSASGDTVTIAHVTTGGKYTGATIQILNGSGVARTCDVIVRGY